MSPYRTSTLLTCPRCTDPLERAAPFDRCSRCDGLWVNEGLLDRVLTEESPSRRWLWWRDPTLTCPRCKEGMQTTLVGECLHIDRCVEHGLWFDAGELATLLTASGMTRDRLSFDQILELIRARLAPAA